ncbi:MAG: hypothetical protein BWX88_02551 [Planctomycetes bacterium ADurb.Bin126]|nr:MAG: hypothetical protein BWX88_02551 [Planctomycetes bacterium ADurb.Bin126]
MVRVRQRDGKVRADRPAETVHQMIRRRRHERVPLVAEMTIQPGDRCPARFASHVFNVSRGGAAVFSPQYFPPGKLAGMAIVLPAWRGGPRRTVHLVGAVRRVQVGDEGNVLGIEFLSKDAGEDYDVFCRYVDALAEGQSPVMRSPWRGGFTLVEACIAMTILCLLVTLSAPVYVRAVEQAALDNAAGNLRTIWSAQRVYWLEHRTFASSLGELSALDLIDPSLTSPSATGAKFVYQVSYASSEGFEVRASRINSTRWTGQIWMNQAGLLEGQITGPRNQVLVPPS